MSSRADTTAAGRPRLMTVTPARLDCFERCPRRFRMTYLDRPTPPPGPPFAHTTLGAAVHTALRELADVEPHARSGERVSRLLAGAWSGLGFRDRNQSGIWLGRATGWLLSYLSAGRLGRPFAVERTVAAPTSTLAISGRVDRLDLRAGEVVVVDYKCGRRPPSRDEAAGSRQLAMYAVAAERTLRTTCRQVELHHLPTGRVLVHRHDAQSLDRQVGRAELLAADLGEALASGDFPARPGPLCGWCDVRAHCPEGSAHAPAREPWAGLPYAAGDEDA